jgi:hypothetical protein
MAFDRLARELLNMTTDLNVADPVKLAAIKDALDISGIQAKAAISVEVSAKPFELVFDSIVAGPRSKPRPAALAALEPPGESDEVIEGGYDDDPLPEDDEIESGREDEDVIDVEIEADGYTDAAGTNGHRIRPVRRSALILA